MRAIILSAVMLAAAAGCGQRGQLLGSAPQGRPATVLAIRAGDAPPNVLLEGKIVEKCPVAGCWFRLQDSTGEIKVDTKSAGFVVTKVPIGTTVTVAGKVAHEGAETIIDAAGLRY